MSLVQQGFNEPWPGFRARIVTSDGKATAQVNRWFEETLNARLQASPVVPEQAVILTGNTDSIAGTISTGSIGNGFYRVSVFLVVIIPAGVASSWTLTITWTYKGIAQSKVFAIVNTNTIATYEFETLVFLADGGTPVAFAVAYTSNPANAMSYDAAFSSELIQQVAA